MTREYQEMSNEYLKVRTACMSDWFTSKTHCRRDKMWSRSRVSPRLITRGHSWCRVRQPRRISRCDGIGRTIVDKMVVSSETDAYISDMIIHDVPQAVSSIIDGPDRDRNDHTRQVIISLSILFQHSEQYAILATHMCFCDKSYRPIGRGYPSSSDQASRPHDRQITARCARLRLCSAGKA